MPPSTEVTASTPRRLAVHVSDVSERQLDLDEEVLGPPEAVAFRDGAPTKAAEYSLTDDSYAKLLGELSERKFDRTSPELRDNILLFYSDLSLPIETKKDARNWQNVLTELDQLKLVTPAPVVAGTPGQ